MKLQAHFWAVLALIILAKPALGQYSTPEEALAADLGKSATGLGKLDPRVALVASGKSGFGEKRPEAHSLELAHQLRAVAIEPYESVRVCEPHNPAAGEYPWSRCRLIGAEDFTAFPARL